MNERRVSDQVDFLLSPLVANTCAHEVRVADAKQDKHLFRCVG